MRPLLAFAGLTVRAALRSRLALALVAALMALVVALPLVVKHDGSAQGFTQILITYTISAAAALLGFATLWWSCGSLAREVEDFSIQLAASKPAPRWQIWLGKWVGVVALDGAMLAVAGAAMGALLVYKSRSLPPDQLGKLRREILVARASAKEPPPNLDAAVETLVQQRLKAAETQTLDPALVRERARQEVLANLQFMRPGQARRWRLPLGSDAAERLKNTPLTLRVKFYSPDYAGIYTTFSFGWEVGPTDGRRLQLENSFAPESFTTFEVPPGLISGDGVLTVDCFNLNDRPVLFQLDDGIEVLYPVGGFAPNLARGMFIVWCWLGLLAAIGLAAAARFQFNVAVFVSCSVLALGLSGKTLKQVVDQGGILGVANETGVVAQRGFVNNGSVMVYGALKWVLDRITGFSPVDALSGGRLITWWETLEAFTVVVCLAGGLFALAGTTILTRRELAAPQ